MSGFNKLYLYETHFKDYCEFSERLIFLVNNIDDTYPVITVYGKYDEIKTLMECLITKGIKIDEGVYLEDKEMSGYDKEFVLYLTIDGVAVNKIWHDDNKYGEAGYSYSEGDISYIHSNCNSKLLKSINSNVICELCIDNIDDIDAEDLDKNVELIPSKRFI